MIRRYLKLTTKSKMRS